MATYQADDADEIVQETSGYDDGGDGDAREGGEAGEGLGAVGGGERGVDDDESSGAGADAAAHAADGRSVRVVASESGESGPRPGPAGRPQTPTDRRDRSPRRPREPTAAEQIDLDAMIEGEEGEEGQVIRRRRAGASASRAGAATSASRAPARPKAKQQAVVLQACEATWARVAGMKDKRTDPVRERAALDLRIRPVGDNTAVGTVLLMQEQNASANRGIEPLFITKPFEHEASSKYLNPFYDIILWKHDKIQAGHCRCIFCGQVQNFHGHTAGSVNSFKDHLDRCAKQGMAPTNWRSLSNRKGQLYSSYTS